MGGFHQTNDWVNVGNVYKIPPNAVIIPLIGDIMHDSEYFENPYKFEPNRYLSKLSDNDIKFTPNPSYPFWNWQKKMSWRGDCQNFFVQIFYSNFTKIQDC